MSGREASGTPKRHRSVRCKEIPGVHHFNDLAVCQCGVQATGPERATPREGMVTVYDFWGRYLGCMGKETWDDLLRDSEAEPVEIADGL